MRYMYMSVNSAFNRPKQSCFNCGGEHRINECTQPKNFSRIRENKMKFMQQSQMQRQSYVIMRKTEISNVCKISYLNSNCYKNILINAWLHLLYNRSQRYHEEGEKDPRFASFKPGVIRWMKEYFTFIENVHLSTYYTYFKWYIQ